MQNYNKFNQCKVRMLSWSHSVSCFLNSTGVWRCKSVQADGYNTVYRAPLYEGFFLKILRWWVGRVKFEVVLVLCDSGLILISCLLCIDRVQYGFLYVKGDYNGDCLFIFYYFIDSHFLEIQINSFHQTLLLASQFKVKYMSI